MGTTLRAVGHGDGMTVLVSVSDDRDEPAEMVGTVSTRSQAEQIALYYNAVVMLVDSIITLDYQPGSKMRERPGRWLATCGTCGVKTAFEEESSVTEEQGRATMERAEKWADQHECTTSIREMLERARKGEATSPRTSDHERRSRTGSGTSAWLIG